MSAKPFKVHTYGPDDPGSSQGFASLDAAREYLKGRLEYWDGQDGGHSDYLRYGFEGFTMKDIGARCDDGWVKFDLPWPPTKEK
jgi:hypothetical protein